MLRSLYKNTSLPAFLVQSLLLKLIIVMLLSLVQLLQTYMYIMVKTYMCYYESESKYVLKLIFLQSTAYIFAGI